MRAEPERRVPELLGDESLQSNKQQRGRERETKGKAGENDLFTWTVNAF